MSPDTVKVVAVIGAALAFVASQYVPGAEEYLVAIGSYLFGYVTKRHGDLPPPRETDLPRCKVINTGDDSGS